MKMLSTIIMSLSTINTNAVCSFTGTFFGRTLCSLITAISMGTFITTLSGRPKAEPYDLSYVLSNTVTIDDRFLRLFFYIFKSAKNGTGSLYIDSVFASSVLSSNQSYLHRFEIYRTIDQLGLCRQRGSLRFYWLT